MQRVRDDYIDHELTADIATHLLTPTASAKIHKLLSNGSLASIAAWADQIKRLKEYAFSSTLHYVNPKDNEPTECNYVQSRDCVKNFCVVSAIFNYSSRVIDETIDQKQRVEALKFLVHFIGDIHQPLHVSGLFRGGNGASAKFDGSKANLHSIWDTTLLTV